MCVISGSGVVSWPSLLWALLWGTGNSFSHLTSASQIFLWSAGVNSAVLRFYKKRAWKDWNWHCSANSCHHLSEPPKAENEWLQWWVLRSNRGTVPHLDKCSCYANLLQECRRASGTCLDINSTSDVWILIHHAVPSEMNSLCSSTTTPRKLESLMNYL